MAKTQIKEIIKDISFDFLTENQLELYNVEFQKEGKDWFLRIYIDKDSEEAGYIGSDDCEKVSRFLSEELDKIDPIEQNYYLEVSSPGMDRQLFETKHYEKYAGQLVQVKLYKGVEGKKQFEGTLKGLIDGNVVIENENGEELSFPLEQVAKANLAVVF